MWPALSNVVATYCDDCGVYLLAEGDGIVNAMRLAQAQRRRFLTLCEVCYRKAVGVPAEGALLRTMAPDHHHEGEFAAELARARERERSWPGVDASRMARVFREAFEQNPQVAEMVADAEAGVWGAQRLLMAAAKAAGVSDSEIEAAPTWAGVVPLMERAARKMAEDWNAGRLGLTHMPVLDGVPGARRLPCGYRSDVKAETVNSAAYFVYALTDGSAIKIGKTSRHPAERLRALQTGSSRKLALLAYTTGVTERYVHRHLWHSHVRAEWFECSPRVLAELKTWAWVDVAVMATVATGGPRHAGATD
jgi:hypothetical protein